MPALMFRMSRLSCGLLLSVYGLGVLQAAPPTLDLAYPAGISRGATATITLQGAVEPWPVQVWSSRPELQIKAAEEKGKITVTAPAGIPLGPVWLRLHNAEGASVLRPFVIGTLPEVEEAEPNQDNDQPQVLSSSTVVVNGRFQARGDVDIFAVQLEAGQTLVADLVSRQILGTPADPSLQITSPKGIVLAQSDDDQGLDPRLVYTAPQAGTYHIRTFAFPVATDSSIGFAGGPNWGYRLTLSTVGFVDYPLPLTVMRGATSEVTPTGWGLPTAGVSIAAGQESAVWFAPQPNLPPAPVRTVPFATFLESAAATAAQELPALPLSVTGVISETAQVDQYRITATKGQPVLLRVQAREWGSSLDPHLEVRQLDGKVIQQQDDANGEKRDSEFAFNPPADGPYILAVRDLHRHGSPRYFYHLELTYPAPALALSVAADQFVHATDKPTEIAVTIQRQHGFAQELEILIPNLPEGVTCAPAKSAAEGETSKAVTLSLAGGAVPFSGPLQIIARVAGTEAPLTTARYTVPEIGSVVEHLWLTVVKK